MSWTNPTRSFWNLGRLFGSRRPRSDRSWVVDQRDGDRWVEFGRHPTEAVAESAVRRLVSDGRGDASSFRVTTRPVQPDEARRVLGFVLLGLVACAVVAVVLVLTWR